MKLETIDWPLEGFVEAVRRSYGSETSAHAFRSLYLWKAEMELSLLCRPEFYAVRFGMRGENSWFFPYGEEEAVRAFLRERMEQTDGPCRLYYAQAKEIEKLEAWFPGRFDIRRAPEDDEYLYDRREQLELKGKPFRRQRHDLHRVQERYSPLVASIGPENINQCHQVLSAWKTRAHSYGQSGLMDVEAGETMLQNFSQLGIIGILVTVEGSPAAVAAGYPLTDSVFDLCVCQQITQDPEISTFARHALLQALEEEFREINGEEDLGIEGLRSLKEGLRPSRKIELYTCIQQL